jgi:SAM-dependent methyltransferase
MGASMTSRPLEESVKNYYDQNAESFITNTLHVDMGDVYERFLPLIPPGGSILDAGCGSGRDALAFHRRGYDVHAFDASPILAGRASELLGQKVEIAHFEDFQCNQSYDGIWACASLLHVPWAGLPEALNNMAVCLKLGGHMYASFKYGEGERRKGSRRFTDMNPLKFHDVLKKARGLLLREEWISDDLRPDRVQEKWFNVISDKA